MKTEEQFEVLPLDIIRLGLVPYEEALTVQQSLNKEVITGKRNQALILCEHSPVITHGKSADMGNLLSSSEQLNSDGMKLHKVGRGGDFTYHGPGQLIAYPLLDLRTRKRDVGWYMRGLEEVVLQTLHHFNVEGVRVLGRTGVFLPSHQVNHYQKICSIGVRLSRWCTFHGLAVYLTNQQKGFAHMHPCGYTDTEVVSLEELGVPFQQKQVENSFLNAFCEFFCFSPAGDTDMIP